MIQNIKQHTLTFPKGITNVPSDMLSSDSELAECVNFTYEDGEMKPIQKPSSVFAGPLKGKYEDKDTQYFLRIVFIHNFHNIENYICVANIDGKLKYVWFKASASSPVIIKDLDSESAFSGDDGGDDGGSSSSSSGHDFGGGSRTTIDNGYTGGTDSIPDVIAGKDFDVSPAKGLGPQKTNNNNNSFRDKFQAIGKTLILSTDTGIYYYLWKDDDYKSLGNGIPEINIRFRMGNRRRVLYSHFDSLSNLADVMRIDPQEVTVDGNKEYYEGDISFKKGDGTYSESIEALDDAAWGSLNTFINIAHKDMKSFIYPFWVRSAIRLYDGSHTHISNPILMLPSIRVNGLMYYADMKGDGSVLMPELYTEQLYYYISNNVNLDDWSDIIKGIDVYVSQEVTSYIPGSHIQISYPYANNKVRGKITLWDGITDENYDSVDTSNVKVQDDETISNVWQIFKALIGTLDHKMIFGPAMKSKEDLIDDLKDTATFFLLSKLKIKQNKDWEVVKIEDGVLENITNQSQLEHDDYYSHTTYIPNVIFAYNNRLHLADVERSFFSGFRHFMPGTGLSNKVTIYVEIESTSGKRMVKREVPNPKDIAIGCYFYYPDPNAKKVYYVVEGMGMVSYDLEEHPFLNGAYYLVDLPGSNSLPSFQTNTIAADYEKNKDAYTKGEYLSNEVFNTEVNNPFVINAVGDNTIGNGTIIGLAANTYALSQGQAGQHPLIVFTSEGIYAMSVASDGNYSNIFNLSREVCNNPGSITETDGAIYFTTDKGLMVMVGVQIAPVSSMLSGKEWKRFTSDDSLLVKASGEEDETPFLDFLKNCSIAYDYKGAKLWIVNPNMKYHYVYNLKSKIFTKMTDDCIKNVVNFYPDTLIQRGDGMVYSFINTEDINKDGHQYSGKFVTRPLKFDGALILETIYQIRNMYLTEGSLKMILYGSDDLKNWNRLSSLSGKPWKYYTLEYILTNWKATDTFTAAVVLLQPRRTEKLR